MIRFFITVDWLKNDRMVQMQTSSRMFVFKEVRKVRSCSKKKNNLIISRYFLEGAI